MADKNDMKKQHKYSSFDNLKYIFSEMWQSQPLMIILLITELIACTANSLLTTFTGKFAVELALTSHTKRLALIVLLMIAGERITKYICDEISDYRLYVGNDKFMYHIKRRLIMKNMSTDYENNESSAKSDALKKAESGNEYAASHAADTLSSFFSALLSLAAYGTILSVLSPLMLLIIGIPSVICFFTERHKMQWTWDNNDKWQRSDRELSYIQSAASDFSAAKDIRIYGMEKWFGDIFDKSFGERLGWYQKQDDVSFRHDMLRFFTAHISDLAAYASVIYMVVKGDIGAGDFVLYFGSIAAFGTAVRNVFDRFSGFEKLSGHISGIREYLDMKDRTDPDNSEKLPEDGCEIAFRDVIYRYSGAEEASVKGISFTLHKGEKLALVGLNGAGKTTLIKLMCGMYDPTEGEILLNGRPVSSFRREEYYSLFSAVFQDISELPVSIAENISGTVRENTDDEKLIKCLSQAGIYEKVMSLPEKENTRLVRSVHEDATELSGGEKQKFALARALYKDGPVLLLDEPTAALDPVAEQQMYQRYADFSEGKTCVFISHRLASTRFCDRIIMIEDGRIIEEGTHAQLMEQGGKYAELYELQSSYYNDGEVQTDG